MGNKFKVMKNFNNDWTLLVLQFDSYLWFIKTFKEKWKSWKSWKSFPFMSYPKKYIYLADIDIHLYIYIYIYIKSMKRKLIWINVWCYTLFYKQHFSSTQPQCCFTFSWIGIKVLLMCCLIHISIIIRRHLLFVSVSRPRSIYVVSISSIILFICIFIFKIYLVIFRK